LRASKEKEMPDAPFLLIRKTLSGIIGASKLRTLELKNAGARIKIATPELKIEALELKTTTKNKNQQ